MACIQKGISQADLAKTIGAYPTHLSAMIHGKIHLPIVMRKIDLFFGEPMFTPPHEFCHWNMVGEAIGIDPVISTMPALRRRAIELGVAPEKLTREELVTKMVGAAASKAKAEREQKATASKITLGRAVEALGPIPAILSPSRPLRSAAAGHSEKSQTKKQSPATKHTIKRHE